MRSLIARYHLKEGFLIALIVPVLFLLSNDNPGQIAGHFLFTFLLVFGLWWVNFSLFDFKGAKWKSARRGTALRLMRIVWSFVLAVLLYVILGWLIGRSAGLLSPARGNWGDSFHSWFYLAFKISVFNALILLTKYAYDSREEKRQMALENEILKRENLNALHESLKQQVSPHFLFNSLTTLKGLTRQHPEQALQFIGELSAVYKYMLHHQERKVATLGEELDFLKSYLYLLRIRFGEGLCTEIRVPEEALSYTMPPNTLQLLIENAVKHNALSQKRPLRITVAVEEDWLIVRNTLQPKNEDTISSHLGIQNISSRYRLLKGREIAVAETEGHFIVKLPLSGSI